MKKQFLLIVVPVLLATLAGTEETDGRSALDSTAERLRSIASEVVTNESLLIYRRHYAALPSITILPFGRQRLKLVVDVQTSSPGSNYRGDQF